MSEFDVCSLQYQNAYVCVPFFANRFCALNVVVVLPFMDGQKALGFHQKIS